MQRLSWGVIKERAAAFAAEFADATDERRDTQSFYNEFFEIFGIKRRRLATYELRVKLVAEKFGFIDLFWPGVLLVEQKSSKLDLRKAQGQGLRYIDGIPDRDQPQYVLTCDFQNWRLADLERGIEHVFKLADLPANIELFAFMLGRRQEFGTQPAVNIAAAELMGKLHESLRKSGYTGHDLERLLVRLLFCMFADDTGIFEPRDIFLQYIAFDTAEDGSDLGMHLNKIFDVLDTAPDQRSTKLRDELAQFPYVNGELFAGALRSPDFDREMRAALIDACRFDWSKVSPAIFGSLFQSVMEGSERRKSGAHYTSEANILKVIGPLFLDDLRAEFASLAGYDPGVAGRGRGVMIEANRRKLQEMQRRLRRINMFDPACGCGNFLVIAYRELRVLELAVLRELYADESTLTGFDGAMMAQVNVDQCHGIEIGEFPARIAEVSLWMADHLANNAFDAVFGTTLPRIPLKHAANIRHGDALEVDWNDVLPAARCTYVMGNPPFIGAKYQSDAQRAQVRRIAGLGGSGGTLDYVAAWFLKGVAYASRSQVRVAFVATNSICQGEQVAQLWPLVFKAGWEIAFAHRSFVWDSEARGKAHVHVVIVGLTHGDAEPKEKRLFSYEAGKGEAVETRHGALTAYLFDAKTLAVRHLVVDSETNPINGADKVIIGSKPIDGGHYIFTASERQAYLRDEPDGAEFLRPYVGSEEFINGGERWIAVLDKASPAKLSRLPNMKSRIAAVRAMRERSPSKGTRDLGAYPTRFHVTVLPETSYLVIPKVSSERREYVPIGWLDAPTVPSDLVFVLNHAKMSDFGILTSRMHMAWLSHIGGRLESRYRYSIGLVYNTFPWPTASDAQRAKISTLAEAVLAARANHPTASLAQLYDPLTMPADLRAAHNALDRAVDRLYRAEGFAAGVAGDRDRVEHLFTRYAAMVDPLATAGAKANARVARAKTRQKGSGA